MGLAQEIEKAVNAHGMWKTRLRLALATRSLGVPVSVIRDPSRCDFGRWLESGRLTAAERNSGSFRRILELHAEFHRVAARAAELATAGRTDEAEQMLEGGGFECASENLMLALNEWKKAS